MSEGRLALSERRLRGADQLSQRFTSLSREARDYLSTQKDGAVAA